MFTSPMSVQHSQDSQPGALSLQIKQGDDTRVSSLKPMFNLKLWTFLLFIDFFDCTLWLAES